MKQLILTFFAVILFYSLFFDKEQKTNTIDEINYIHQNAASVPNLKAVPDTLNYFALYNMGTIKTFGWNYYTTYFLWP